jgi:hypothetical protein
MTDVANTLVPQNAVEEDDALQRIFQPPFEIREHPTWVEMFHAQVAILRRDSAGLPLDMAQRQLIERIATTYVRVKWFETMGGMSQTQLVELNKLYLAYIAQFQKVLAASDEVLRQDLLNKMAKITQDAVKLISNDEDRARVRSYLMEQFTALGY